MALSDIEIRAEIRAQRLIFTPRVDDDDRIDSSSVDLLLDEGLIVLAPGSSPGVIVDPSEDGFSVMQFLRNNGNNETIADQGYRMGPNQLVIARTLETIKLPRHLAARVEGKSSLARLGLSVHVTAPSVHAGFEGAVIP